MSCNIKSSSPKLIHLFTLFTCRYTACGFAPTLETEISINNRQASRLYIAMTEVRFQLFWSLHLGNKRRHTCLSTKYNITSPWGSVILTFRSRWAMPCIETTNHTECKNEALMVRSKVMGLTKSTLTTVPVFKKHSRVPLLAKMGWKWD